MNDQHIVEPKHIGTQKQALQGQFIHVARRKIEDNIGACTLFDHVGQDRRIHTYRLARIVSHTNIISA